MVPVVHPLFELVAEYVAVLVGLTDLLVFADVFHTCGGVCIGRILRSRRGAFYWDGVGAVQMVIVVVDLVLFRYSAVSEVQTALYVPGLVGSM